MPPRLVINDALWRCLCPSFQSVRTAARSAGIGAVSNVSAAPPRAARGQLRTYTFTYASRDSSASHSAKLDPPVFSRRPRPNVDPRLVQLPTHELYEQLRREGAAGRHYDVMDIIKILIKDRREPPNSYMYNAILHSFASSTEGTAGKIRKVLEQMQEDGIELDARGCQCVLEALAVHPDYLLRIEMLEYMKERWYNLSDSGHNFIAAGLLRDRLFEQALEKLDAMAQQQIKIEGWLWDKTLWFLLDYGEVEEAFHVLMQRREIEGQRLKLSHALWTHFLEHAAKMQLTEPTSYIWNTQVVPGYIKPPTGTCHDVLATASKHGNVKLATDVFRVLTERGTVFESQHYEMLIETYLKANDLEAALSVVLIMQESGLKVQTATVHPLFYYLKKDSGRPMQAFSILQNFEATMRQVPTAAVNACLQASVFLERLEEAIEIYKALHTVSKAGPDTHTFNVLFQGCHKAGRKELAMFLAQEMIKLKFKPDALTYDRLILVCCSAEDLDDAMLYYQEAKADGFAPRRGTFEVLIKKAVENGDERAVPILKDYQQNIQHPSRFMESLVKRYFEENATEAHEPSTMQTDPLEHLNSST